MPVVIDEDIVFNNPTSVLIIPMELTKIMIEIKKITISSKI